MRNFVFISPNFPSNYQNFCRELKNNGFNVLGIGDCAYDLLTDELRGSLTEYYRVNSLENYDEVYRAVAFFIFKYGKIEYIESNNEYWLERDALLRTEFNISTGFHVRDMKKVKFKSEMKKYYKKIGLKVARHYLVKTLSGCKKFIGQVGYPVIVKPNIGVGANSTFRIKNEDELKAFMAGKPSGYIMEEYIDGAVNSYDAIVDGEGNPVFESGLVETASLMDTVNDGLNSCYYYLGQPYEDIREAGRKVLKAFKVKNRFVHFEFFRLLSDQSIGKKGEICALEVNMRPAGGCSPDMINYANSTDVYKIWADVLAFGKTQLSAKTNKLCGYAGRRYGKTFTHDEPYILQKYADKLMAVEHIPEVLVGTMGNIAYIADFDNREEMFEFFKDVVE